MKFRLQVIGAVIGLFVLQYCFSLCVIYFLPLVDWNGVSVHHSYISPRFFSGDTSFPHLSELWQKWDSNYYMKIAMEGYDYVQNDLSKYQVLAYYPLYPIIVRLLSLSYILDYKLVFVTGIIVSVICFATALLYLKKLCDLLNLTSDQYFSLLLLIITFPASYFFFLFYPESLFFLLSILFFYFLFKRKYLFVSFTLALAIISKPQAITLVFPFYFYFLNKEFKVKNKIKRIVHLVLYTGIIVTPILLFYAFIFQLTQDIFAIFTIQKDLGNSSFYPFGFFVKYLEVFGFSLQPPYILTAILLIILICAWVIAAKKFFGAKWYQEHKAEWISLFLYTFFYLWMLSSVQNLSSIFRYSSENFALFLIPVAFLTIHTKKVLFFSILFIFLMFHFLFFILFLTKTPAYGF